MKMIGSFETLVLTRTTPLHIPEDGISHSGHRGNLKSYTARAIVEFSLLEYNALHFVQDQPTIRLGLLFYNDDASNIFPRELVDPQQINIRRIINKLKNFPFND
jgi:hypothetical protein